MTKRPRFIVYEQELGETGRINDCFGVFTSYDKAEALRKKLQAEHPDYWYGIRELLNGSLWAKS